MESVAFHSVEAFELLIHYTDFLSLPSLLPPFLPISMSPSSLYHYVAHDCCEEVSVTLCSVCRGVSEAPEDLKPCLGRVAPLAEHRFSFVQDLAFDMAQFLVSDKTSHFHF